MTAYLTNASGSGRLRFGQLPGSTGVVEALDMRMSIQIATAIGRTHTGLAVWRLRVHGAAVPGRWVIDNGHFVEVDNGAG